MGQDRLYEPRKPYKGHDSDARKLEKDLHEELKRLKTVTRNVDKGIDAAVAVADAAQTETGKKSAQMSGHHRTAVGTGFNSTTPTWTDIPDGAGTVSQILTTKGGKVLVLGNITALGVSNKILELQITQDGVAGSIVTTQGDVNGKDHTLTHQELFSPAAGLHTYVMQGRTTDTANWTLNHATLEVVELRDES